MKERDQKRERNRYQRSVVTVYSPNVMRNKKKFAIPKTKATLNHKEATRKTQTKKAFNRVAPIKERTHCKKRESEEESE